eukprot:CAMPEP_0172682900 /NCGR_PEP_ID=MMETSP1074-20121228/18477_1 /TAXON_ID=2916 /ORGANISM="Ceratium fusus, Strain PA161109" /LENGTH=646 /DNA_ID=CAMNT_0013501663 /DNA_START=27 /DNA_END=1968 /DNA_ORIENTATION=+
MRPRCEFLKQLLVALAPICSALPGAHWYDFEGNGNVGFVEDGSAGKVWTQGKTMGTFGSSRSYLVDNLGAPSWYQAQYHRFDLRGQTMSYTVDLSKVPCGCIACMYLVAMPNPGPGPNYCDIQPGKGFNQCLEVDLMEANSMAYHSTIHTEAWGTGEDGTCNAILGCVNNVGREWKTPQGNLTKDIYRPGARVIDSSRPFKVTSSFEWTGHMTVILSQDNDTVVLFNRSLGGNPMGTGVPDAAAKKVADAMANGGLVLVSSLWNGDTHWLDKAACGGQQGCNIGGASFTVSDLEVHQSPTTTSSTMTATTSTYSTTSTTTGTTATATTSTMTTLTSSTTTMTTTVTVTHTTATQTSSTFTDTSTTSSTNTTTQATLFPTLPPLTLAPISNMSNLEPLSNFSNLGPISNVSNPGPISNLTELGSIAPMPWTMPLRNQTTAPPLPWKQTAPSPLPWSLPAVGVGNSPPLVANAADGSQALTQEPPTWVKSVIKDEIGHGAAPTTPSQSNEQEAAPSMGWMPSLVHTGKMLDFTRKVETYPESSNEASVSWKISNVMRPLAMLAVFSLTLACTCAMLRVNNVRQRASPMGVSHDRHFLSASRRVPFEAQEADMLLSFDLRPAVMEFHLRAAQTGPRCERQKRMALSSWH